MLFMDEMKQPDLHYKIQAIESISTIALTLGPEKTKQLLLPNVADMVEGDPKLKVALARSLITLKEVLYQGEQENVFLLLKPLEELCSSDKDEVL